MSRRVVAIEGFFEAAEPVAWGAAAVDDQISEPIRASLISEGHLTPLPQAVEIADSVDLLDCIAVRVTRQGPYAELLAIDPGRVGGVVGYSRTAEYDSFAFADRGAFKRYSDARNTTLANEALYKPLGDAQRLDLLDVGLLLDPTSAIIRAMRVAFAPEDADREYLSQLSEAVLATDSERELFRRIKAACLSNDKTELVLTYDKGVAQGGGLDINIAFSVMRALSSIMEPAIQRLVSMYRFLTDPPSPRFKAMLPGSANLHFVAVVDGRPIGDKVARYLELDLLQRLLRGEIPEDLRSNRDFQTALRAFVSPGPGTTLTQVPIGSTASEPVEVAEAEDAAADDEVVLQLFGIHVGHIGATTARTSALRATIEVAISVTRTFPRGNKPEHKLHTIRVLTVSDGRGGHPRGLEYFNTGNEFLYRPAVFTVLRKLSPEDPRPTYYLQTVTFLSDDHSAIVTHIPSVFSDGFISIGRTTARRASNLVTIDNVCDIDIGNEPSLPHALSTMAAFAQTCADIEFADGDADRIAPPFAQRGSSVLVRLLHVLVDAGGELANSIVVARMNELAITDERRINNTRREVIRNPDLLEFVGANEKATRITARGRHFLAAFIAMRGRIREDAPNSRAGGA